MYPKCARGQDWWVGCLLSLGSYEAVALNTTFRQVILIALCMVLFFNAFQIVFEGFQIFLAYMIFFLWPSSLCLAVLTLFLLLLFAPGCSWLLICCSIILGTFSVVGQVGNQQLEFSGLGSIMRHKQAI